MEYYSHFTSPIRRYADLIIHRIIKQQIHNKLDNKSINIYKNSLKETTKHITDTEKKSEKLEYDVNTVFIAVELTNLLGTMKDIKFANDTEVKEFKVDATEITYIYHLIATHKVKGLTKDSYVFADILRRIGEISKVFNYYDTTGKNMAQDVQDWVVLFDESITLEERPVLEVETEEAN